MTDQYVDAVEEARQAYERAEALNQQALHRIEEAEKRLADAKDEAATTSGNVIGALNRYRAAIRDLVLSGTEVSLTPDRPHTRRTYRDPMPTEVIDQIPTEAMQRINDAADRADREEAADRAQAEAEKDMGVR